MSHFDDIWPVVKDVLAFLGFLTVCGAFLFFLVMTKHGIEDKLEDRKIQRAKAKTLEALKEKWQGVAIEQH